MPPPAASSAAPAPVEAEVEEEAPPKLSPREMLARMLGVRLKPDPHVEVLLERSAGISFDPKMKDLSYRLQSHVDTDPFATSSTAGSPTATAGRSGSSRRPGRNLVDRRMKDLERSQHQQAVGSRRPRFELQRLDSVSVSGVSPLASPINGPPAVLRQQQHQQQQQPQQLEETKRQHLEKFDASFQRKQYRDNTDKTLKRLLVDIDLACDPDRQRHYSHQSRCDHLDKMHGWYFDHIGVEQKKDTKPGRPPPYLLFNREGPVSPGSMRVQHPRPSPLLTDHLRRSCSSPAALKGGA